MTAEKHREKVYEAASRFVQMGKDPHLGTVAWNLAMDGLYKELLAVCREVPDAQG